LPSGKSPDSITEQEESTPKIVLVFNASRQNTTKSYGSIAERQIS
jgi:hypothetical protein